MKGGGCLTSHQCLSVGRRETLAILVQLRLQPALGCIGIEVGLRNVETAAKEAHDKRHHCHIPECQTYPHARGRGNAEIETAHSIPAKA